MKKGLVMEGGAMRGMFTAGVTDVFMENGIEFDGAVGISAGATFGCNYKSKQIGRALRYNKRYSSDPRYGSFSSLIKTGNLFETEFCYHEIPYVLDKFDTDTFEKNPMEFWIGASDVRSGKPHYVKMNKGDAVDLEWIRASASIPLVSQPVEIDGGIYLDGGIADSIPLEFFESIGYDRNVVIMTQPRDFVKQPNKLLWLVRILYHKYPAFIETFKNRHLMYNREKAYAHEKGDRGDVFVICPEEPLNIKSAESDPNELQRVYDIGRLIALRNLEGVKAFLGK